MSVSVKPISVLPVSMDAEAPQLLSLADYVDLTAPNDFQASDANYETDAFKIRTTAGTCLEFYNGRLYMAINNFVYCTKAFDIEHYDIRYNVVAGFASAVRMIARVEGGLFVATDTDTYFLAGSGPLENNVPGSGFEQRHIMKYGAIYGTVARVQADHVGEAGTKDTTVLWASTIGIVAGSDNGSYKLLSQNKVTLPTGLTGTAIIKEVDGSYQYMVCFNVGSDLFINSSEGVIINNAALLDSWVVNVSNSYHSRYTNFVFNSFFKFDHVFYGANALGIYALTGDKDFAGEVGLESPIDAFTLHPNTDFTIRETKYGSDAYIGVRSSADMVLDVTVDEEVVCTNLPFPYKQKTGTHRRRAKLPRGLKGTTWQLKVKNVAGGDFKLFGLEVSMQASARSI